VKRDETWKTPTGNNTDYVGASEAGDYEVGRGPQHPLEYVNDSRHGGHGPSRRMHSLETPHKGQTILYGTPPNNVGKATLPIDPSLEDMRFNGGTDFTDADVMLRDAHRDEAGRPTHNYEGDDYRRTTPLRVNDEVGHRGKERRTARGFEDDRANTLDRGFIPLRFIGHSS
jgi:hypothetical protein